MKKQYAIALLGGTPTEAAKNYGSTSQAVSQWADILPKSVEALVMFQFQHLPKKLQREYMAAAKATEVQA